MTVGYLRDSKECKDLTFLTHFNGDLQGSDCISDELRNKKPILPERMLYRMPYTFGYRFNLGKTSERAENLASSLASKYRYFLLI